MSLQLCSGSFKARAGSKTESYRMSDGDDDVPLILTWEETADLLEESESLQLSLNST